MKNFLKGFTLAEVLVTLGIVGVIASLTLPSLSVNIQRQQIGPALAKAISSLEAANRLAMQQEQVRHITDVIPDNENISANDYFTRILARYMPTTQVVEPSYAVFGGNNGAINLLNNRGDAFQSNDNVIYIPEMPVQLRIQPIILGGGNMPQPVQAPISSFNVYVDVNGTRGPNVGGRDLLMLTVGADGRVFAAGSREYRNAGLPALQGACPGNWQVCAGRIADNGFQVDY